MTTQPGSSVLVTPWFPRVAAIFAVAALASACGGADDRPGRVRVESGEASTSKELEQDPDSKQNAPTDEDGGVDEGAECEKGDAKECRVTLPSQGSVKNCVEGVRYCDDGRWGSCEIE